MKKAIIAILVLALACCMAGCQKKPAADTDGAGMETVTSLEDYLASTKDKSDAIKASLEQEIMTQTDMNLKSEELRALWDEAMIHLLDEAKKALTGEEWTQLTAEQTAWEAERTIAVEAAGKAYEGGSLYPLIVNSEAARLTEERVYTLYELLK